MSIFGGKSFLIFFLFNFFVPVRIEIIFSPKDTEALVGESVTIFCSTSLGSCEWYHRPIGARRHEIVYQEGFLYNEYKKRFNVTKKEDKTCNLLITNVRVTDAGLFTCMEVLDKQTEKKAELIVFEKYPSDESCALKITCNPLCNYMELSCTMKSYGNISPFLEWRDSTGNLVDSSTVKTQSVIQVNEDLSQHLRYTCYVKYPNNSLSSKLHWSYSTSVYLAYKPNDKTEVYWWRSVAFVCGSYATISTSIYLCWKFNCARLFFCSCRRLFQRCTPRSLSSLFGQLRQQCRRCNRTICPTLDPAPRSATLPMAQAGENE